MDQNTLCRQLRIADQSLVFLLLLIASVLLSCQGIRLQRAALCRQLRGESGETPGLFPVRLGASALVVGVLGFFLCLAVHTWQETGPESAPAERQSTRTNLWASLLVFLAALLRLDDLMQNAPCPD